MVVCHNVVSLYNKQYSQVGDDTLYSTPSEYIRDIIRREREKVMQNAAEHRIMAGVRDLAAGNYSEFDRDNLLSGL